MSILKDDRNKRVKNYGFFFLSCLIFSGQLDDVLSSSVESYSVMIHPLSHLLFVENLVDLNSVCHGDVSTNIYTVDSRYLELGYL